MVDSLQSTRQTVANHIFEGVKRYLIVKRVFLNFVMCSVSIFSDPCMTNKQHINRVVFLINS